MAHLPPPIARVRAAIRTFLTARSDDGALAAGDLLLVACSGGADSVALASQVAFLAPRLGLRAGLITIDHGMQEGSAEQATRVVELGERLELDPILSSRPQRPEARTGPEGTARDLRYAAFESALDDTGARAVLLGHTMDDQAETVLLGLARGAGTRTLAGMMPIRGRFWRPLLPVRRADTLAACAALDLPVWHDPTNDPDGPWRTAVGDPLPRAAVRHHVLPGLEDALGQDPVPPLARTAELLSHDLALLDALAAEHHHLIREAPPREGIGHTPPAGAVVDLDVEAARALPQALRWRVLREFMIRGGAPAQNIGIGHARAVDALLTQWRGQRGVSVPGDRRAVRSCGRLYIVTPPNQERT